MPILSGVTNVSIDGTVYDCAGGVKFTLSTVEREEVTSQSGRVNYREKPIAGSIETDLFITSDLDPTIFASMTGVPVVVDCATGAQLVGSGMFQTGSIEYDAIEGSTKVTFKGQNVTVVTA